MNDMRVTETDMDCRFTFDPLKCPVDRFDCVLLCNVRPCLHVGFIQLHYIRACGEECMDLFIYGGGIVHSGCLI